MQLLCEALVHKLKQHRKVSESLEMQLSEVRAPQISHQLIPLQSGLKLFAKPVQCRQNKVIALTEKLKAFSVGI